MLPRIDAAVDVIEGRVAGNGWAVERLALRLPALRAGAPTSLAISGEFVTPLVASAPPAAGVGLAGATDAPGGALSPRALSFDATLKATPRQLADGVRFEPLVIEMQAPHPATLQGFVEFGAATAVSLAGELPSWPEAWPALPLPSEDPAAPVRVEFEYGDEAIRAKLARGDEAIDIEMTPGDLAAWRNDPDAPLLPPLTGNARSKRLQFGGIELRGVQLRVEDDDAKP